MGVWADRVVDRFDTQEVWPLPDDQRVWDQIRTWIAFQESDRNVLRANARWRNQVRQYLVDPLAPKISEAFASVIFGSRPTVTAAAPDDQPHVDWLVSQNNLGRRWQREHKRVSAEAETWWRATSNPSIDPCPQVTFSSRLDVCPLFSGNDELRAAAFVDDLYPLEGDGSDTVWRHFEIIDDESIRNVLYQGTENTIGVRLELTAHPATQDLWDQVEHELPVMPAGRVINREGIDVFYGISDYSGIEDFLYGLNEILTIFHENVRLTLKKRVVVPASATDEAGTIDVSTEVLVREEPLNQELGATSKAGSSSEFEVLEYTSDIEEVIKAQNAEAINALTRVGITPSFVGMTGDQGEGRSVTGTALRLKLIPTTNAGEDRAANWDDQNPIILMVLQLLDAREKPTPGDQVLGGFGVAWTNPATPPSVQRGSSLPQDPIETSEMHATRVTAGIESRYTAIQDMHPNWTDEQILQEIDRIDADIAAKAPTGSLLDSGGAPEKIPGV